MTKLYLIVLSTSYDREAIKDLFDKHPQIAGWFYSLPHSVFIQSHLSAKDLSNMIINKFGRKPHVVVEVTSNYWGSLEKTLWDRFPKSSNL